MDEFALTVGAHITELMRKDDSLARLGKGAFGVLLSSADITLANGFAERVQLAFSKLKITLNGNAVTPTLSIGLECSSPGRQRQLAGMLKTARERLMLASKTGNSIRPLPQSKTELVKINSIDKALALVVSKSDENLDLSYVMKRLLPLLVRVDKEFGTSIAKSALPAVKGTKKEGL